MGWSNCSWKERVGTHPGFLGSQVFTEGNLVPRQGAIVSGSGLTGPTHPPPSTPAVGCSSGHRILCNGWKCRGHISRATSSEAWTLTQPRQAGSCGVRLGGGGSRFGSVSIGHGSRKLPRQRGVFVLRQEGAVLLEGGTDVELAVSLTLKPS